MLATEMKGYIFLKLVGSGGTRDNDPFPSHILHFCSPAAALYPQSTSKVNVLWSCKGKKERQRSVVSDSCDAVNCSLLGVSVHGILQTRMLEWVAISFSRGTSQPRN